MRSDRTFVQSRPAVAIGVALVAATVGTLLWYQYAVSWVPALAVWLFVDWRRTDTWLRLT